MCLRQEEAVDTPPKPNTSGLSWAGLTISVWLVQDGPPPMEVPTGKGEGLRPHTFLFRWLWGQGWATISGSGEMVFY